MEITKITPITTFRILRGVNIDPAYSDVMSHGNKQVQASYFAGKAKFTCTNAVPIRNNVVRVPYTADQLYDCNYVMYQNANFADKWFYAFIQKITWINVNVSELELVEDVWETWQFDLTYHPCYVERQHINNDTYGMWREPEPFDVSNKLQRFRTRTNMRSTGNKIAIFWVPQDAQYLPWKQGDLVSMCQVSTISPNNLDDFFKENIQPLIDVGLSDNVISVFMCPGFVASGDTYNLTLNRNSYMSLDGYVPANKKMLCFPYNSIQVASQNGVQAEYMMELFEDNTMEFKVQGSLSPDLTLYGSFVNYEKLQDTDPTPNSAYTSVVSGWPQVMFSGLATLGFVQNAASQALQLTAGIREEVGKWIPKLAPAVLSGLAGGKTDIIEKNAGTIGNIASSLYESAQVEAERMATGDYSRIGQLPSSTSAWQIYQGEFCFLHNTIDAKRAELYDKYLTRYGYAVNTISSPITSGREIFNFVKTKGAIITGNIPVYAKMLLESAFDQGITIWHQERGHEIGSWGGGAAGNPIV